MRTYFKLNKSGSVTLNYTNEFGHRIYNIYLTKLGYVIHLDGRSVCHKLKGKGTCLKSNRINLMNTIKGEFKKLKNEWRTYEQIR